MGAAGTKDKGKGVMAGWLPDSAVVEVTMTVETARELIKALTLEQPFAGPNSNSLLSELSRVLMITGDPKLGDVKYGGKQQLTKTSSK
jgi:hypothetical protein